MLVLWLFSFPAHGCYALTFGGKSRFVFLPITASLGKGSDTMSGTYDKLFISKPQTSLID